MPQRYRKRNNDDFESDGFKIVFGMATLAVMYFGFIYSVDKAQFWYEIIHYLLPALGVFILLIVLYIAFVTKMKAKSREKLDELFRVVKESGFESEVKNFIDRFGKEGKKESWKYRGYTFDWSRLNDFRERLIGNNITVSKNDYSDLVEILKHYIDIKEKDFLNNGIVAKTSHRFDELNKEGSDFEHLIVRLYNAMGYISKRTGGSGDQGADVIASKDGVNVLIQAKCYLNPVNNEAVQQANTALSYHGCSKAVVITTSTFTTGAIDLAKANSVELIDGERLRRMLLEHLKEVWI